MENSRAKKFPGNIYLGQMHLASNLKSILVCAVAIILVFVAVSFLDIVIAVMYARFYSNAAFIVTFGVGGIFAAVLGYMNGIEKAERKDGTSRWILVIFMILTGILFFTFLARIEGGEYEAAFKAYGITLAVGSLLFAREKIY